VIYVARLLKMVHPNPKEKSTMKPSSLVLVAVTLFAAVGITLSQTDSGAATAAPQATTERDGQHGFDFELGSWKIHLKRRLHPLTGSNVWVEFDGTSVTRKVWEGRSQVEEFETDSAGGHIEGLTLRLYNPQTHQWGLYWANQKDGTIVAPQVGQFKDGRGEFYGQDTLDGKLIYIRFIWSNTDSNMPHFEQSFSDDGGKTWEVNWITDQTRVSPASIKAHVPAVTPTESGAKANTAERDGQHDFDFDIGDWNFHLKRRLNPLADSPKWVEEVKATGHCFKLWDGRADMHEFEADGPTGHIEGLTLRLYNPETHQWRLYWANSRTGKMEMPQIGEFKNGRGEFYAQDMLNGKIIFVRFDWTNTTTSTPHFEQSFSNDGGKTWEVNWITDQTRVSEGRNSQ
jgi:hypothetical protein